MEIRKRGAAVSTTKTSRKIKTIKPTFWAVLSRNGVIYEHTVRTTRKAAREAFIVPGTGGWLSRQEVFNGWDGGEPTRVVKVRVVPVEDEPPTSPG